MTQKLYIDGAVVVAQKAQKYLTRWQPKLVVSATPEQVTALTNLIGCLAAFLVEWRKATPIN